MSDAKTRMGATKDWISEHRRPLMSAFAILAVIMLIIGLSFSWFVNNKALSTIGKVEGPATLKIKGPNQTAMEQVDLTYDADMDTTAKDDDGSEIVTRRRAFCVESQGKGFELQIANTTNIKDLNITIYRATDMTKSPDNADVVGRDGLNAYYAWKKGDEVTGFQAINEEGSTGIATSKKDAANFDSQTFGGYDDVQKNARTLYRWKAISENDLDEPKSETSATKYIIECSWPKATNIKESDVVYIIARSGSSASGN